MTGSRFQSIRNFYRSAKWKIARSIKIEQAKGPCEKCGRVGTEVHHIIHLTPENRCQIASKKNHSSWHYGY